VLAQLEAWHPDTLRVAFRHFPLITIHDKASLAGQAAEAAGAQGAFWLMHDLLFERWDEWVALSPGDYVEWLIQVAEDLQLDVEQFGDDLQSGRFEQAMQESFENAAAAGLPGTPYIFFNNAWFRLPPDLINFEAVIRLTLLEARLHEGPPTMALEPEASYIAKIHLDSGVVLLRLLPESAPQTVNNFIFLAQEGWFNGNGFHQVVPGSFIESGDPTQTGFGNPGYSIPDEIDPALSFDSAGLVAMSSSGPNTNGSQFFISLGPLPELDGSRTIFGEVVEGLNLLQDLEARDPFIDLLTPPETSILSVTIEVE
jgi:cyclophilin family peptidyl-prolyl cis-trans isomerase